MLFMLIAVDITILVRRSDFVISCRTHTKAGIILNVAIYDQMLTILIKHVNICNEIDI